MKGEIMNKIFNSIKSKVALFIVLTMVLTLVLPHMSILSFNNPTTTYAAGTELKDESGVLPITEHSCNSTMYYWGNGTRLWDNDENGYNVLGISGKDDTNDTFFDGFVTCVYNNNRSGEPRLAGYTMDARLYNPENPMNDTDPYNSGAGASTNIGAGAENEKMTNGLVRTLTNVDDNSKKAEIKLTTSVSPDKRYVFLDLYAINLSSNPQMIAFRCREDLSVEENQLHSRVIMNDFNDSIAILGDMHDGWKFRNKNIVTKDNIYELDPLSVRYYTNWSGYKNDKYKWAKNTNEPWNDVDAYLIFGWKNVEMGPYQKIHKRLALLTRNTTYYVNSELGIDTTNQSDWTGMTDKSKYPPDTEWRNHSYSFPGAFDKPFKTLKYAIERLGSTKGYICIQNDCEVNETINIDSDKDITIQSTDLALNRLQSTDTYELKIATNSYINMTGGNLTIQNIKINGQGEEREKPFVNQTGGKLVFSAGSIATQLINKKGAAFVDCSGDDSELGLFGVNVSYCKSGEKAEIINNDIATISCCAINYNGKIPSGVDEAGNDNVGFEMNGENIINSNTNFHNEKANIYLGNGRIIQVSNLLTSEKTGATSNISVTTKYLPQLYIGAVTKESEEVVVAKPTNTYPKISGILNCPFEQYFHDDRTAANNRIEIAEGRVTGGANAKKNVVVKQLGSRISFRYVRDDGAAMQGLSREDMTRPVGDFLVIEATPSEMTGFEMIKCQVIGNGFTIDDNKESPTFGTAQGIVGTSNVEIRYIYKAQNVVFSFVPNGGTPEHIPNIEGQASKRVSGVLSKLTKYGYLFAGWYDNIDDPYDTGTTGKITSLPQTFPNASQKYYAKYNIDPNISIPVSENHTNLDGSIIFYETPDSEVYPATGNRNVESSIGFPSRAIPGYRPKISDSFVTPATYVYRSAEEEVGTFEAGTGTAINFTGKTPGQQTLVSFKYEPDNTEYTFRREFYKVNSAGTNPQPLNVGGNTYVESTLHAEDLIDYTPSPREGFNIIGGSITAGDTDDLANYIYKLTGSFDQYNSFKFTGKMPNQNVTLAYYYQSTANDKEFIVDWNDVESNDDRNRNIYDTFIEEHSFEDAISADKKTGVYGYIFSGNEVSPNTAGTFDSNNHFSGTMPLNQAVTVTYKYTRDPNYFKNIVYKPSLEETGCTTTLNVNDLSPDLIVNGDGNPATKVLLDGGTATTAGWSLDNLNTRELIPRVSVNDSTLYSADSFFVDMNGDQKYNAGDRILTDDSKFTTADIVGGVITIVPHVEVLFSDINISFVSDGNATIDTTGIQTNYRSIDTWQTAIDTGIPDTSSAGYYYTFDGWYLNNIKVQATDLLVNGGEYVAKFIKDTSMADAPKKVLYTTSIDSSGNGQINIRDVHTGYIYILADTDNKVKAKALANGTSLSFNHTTDGVHVNTTYHLYEMINVNNIFDSINLEDDITTIGDASDRSQVSLCYVPAVLKNYSVSVDTSAMSSGSVDVAKVTIKPTSSDYSYKILDGSTTVCDWQSGAVSGITFEGLKPGKNYKVVTKNNLGVESTSTGTNLYIDTLYNLTQNAYVVTVVNGTVDGQSSKIVNSGEVVNIETLETEGTFKWTSLLGSPSINNITSQSTSFTMPAKNVIVVAKKNVPDTNKIKLTSGQFGTNDYNVYMDNSDEMGIINTLAGDAENYLSTHNFNIRYNVTYNKDILTFEEQNQIGGALGAAARGAIAIDVDVDRYIDNKRVDSNNFDPNVPPLTGSSLMGTGADMITELFGEDILDKVPGLEEYLNGENQDPTEAAEASTYIFDDDEPEGEDTITTEDSEETTTVDSTKEESTTVESTAKETKSEEPTIKEEQTEAEESEATEATVGAFTGTEIVEASTEGEGANNELDYDELVQNLMLFGSDFTNTLNVNTYVTLPNADLNNGDYKVFESGAGEVASILYQADESGKKGIIGFTATKGKRYIIAYNRYNDVVVVNNNPGIQVASPSAVVKFEERIKYGDNLSAYVNQLPTRGNYSYNRATYHDGEFSYKNNEKVTFSLSDPILTPITIYVVYDSDAADVSVLMAGINEALEKARIILDNYFLLTTEQSDINAKVRALQTLLDSSSSTNNELLSALTELESVLDEVEPKLAVREADYKKQDIKKNQTSSTPTSYTGYTGGGSGGGGGGGGGGRAAAQGQAAGLAGPGGMTTALTPELEATDLGALTTPVAANAVQNIPNVPASVTSKSGMTKINFNDSVSSFVKSDGSLVKNEWIETNYGWYHANTSGALDIGWSKIGNDWFYFNVSNTNNAKNLMHTGWLQDTSTHGTSTYYMAANGSMMTGYQTINGSTYYFDPISGLMLTNTTAPDGRTIGADGIIR